MAEMRGCDLVVEYLVREKVPYMFGYAGHGAVGLLDGVFSLTRYSTTRSQPRISAMVETSCGGREIRRHHRSAGPAGVVNLGQPCALCRLRARR